MRINRHGMYYLEYIIFEEHQNYIYVHRCNNEPFILDVFDTRTTRNVGYDDIHSFLETHREESRFASLIIDAKDISGELLHFMKVKMRRFITEFEMNVLIIRCDINLKSHVLDFIEKMRYRNIFPHQFEVTFDNGPFFTISNSDPLN